ncbi:hypothetical protein [Catellatospora sp. NPDC049609]|uniref:hypothetical protein n=1 Tax=Catellatospora sp. NPDC049609 TaxID=3155505 RepID=UPI003440CEC7
MILTHLHQQNGSTYHADVPGCCLRHIEDRYRGEREDAVRAERRRIVLAALAGLDTYIDIVRSMYRVEYGDAMISAATKAAETIRKAGCICPVHTVAVVGGGERQVPGRDPRCGLHDEEN